MVRVKFELLLIRQYHHKSIVPSDRKQIIIHMWK